MRVLLRHRKTGHYFTPQEGWTDEEKSALAFNHSSQAVQRAVELGLRDIELLLTFDDPQYNIRMPLESPPGA